MWNFLKGLFSFASSDEKSLSKQEEKELISFAMFANKTKVNDDLIQDSYLNYNCGTVTSINSQVGVIDGKHYFNLNPALQNISIGDYVQFMLDKNQSNVIVKNIDRISSENNGVMSSKIDERESDNDNFLTITGTVKFKHLRKVFVSSDECGIKEVCFNLDTVNSEFIPIQGDIITLKGFITEFGTMEFSVKKIEPKAAAVKMGTVTMWNTDQGIISDFATFSLESCEPGYCPTVGDKVLASLINVINDTGFVWRAIQVIPQFSNVEHLSKTLKEARPSLTENQKDIFISIFPQFTLKIHSSVKFAVEVENKSKTEVELQSIYPWPENCSSQVSLINPTDTHFVIIPNNKLTFNFKIEAQFIGCSSVEYVWDFGFFKIHRMFELEVTYSDLNQINFHDDFTNTLPNYKNKITATHLVNETTNNTIPGKRKYRCSFYPVQLGSFSLPKKIINAVLPDYKMRVEEHLLRVLKVLPCLEKELCPQTYAIRMSGLLYLEEVERLKQIRELSLERASFRKSGDYLILSLPKVSAHTNRLISGDKVIASIPWNQSNIKYEGVIHRIVSNEFWIQFFDGFHYNYVEGTQLSIYFIASRVTLRRMHQAVHLARRFLGDEWLFPTGVPTSMPLVIFTKGSKSEKSVRKSMFSSKINWNRSGSGYGPHCTINNVINNDVIPEYIHKIRWINNGLNKIQQNAIIHILKGKARPLPYVIFGPPGTGKSITIVEAVLQAHLLFGNSRILIATPSNSAADLLATRILAFGTVAQEEILRLSSSSALEQGRLSASLFPYAAVLSTNEHVQNNYNVCKINRESLPKYRIIISTIGCIGALFNNGCPRGFFTHMFFDEVGQVTEPELLTSLILLNVQSGQVILAGDPIQLGPVVLSKLARKFGLQDSLLIRLMDRFPYKKDPVGFPDSYGYDPRLVTKLVHNYRSLPVLLQLSNLLFYDGHLIPREFENTDEECILLQKLSSVMPVKSTDTQAPSLIFHGVRGEGRVDNSSRSWFNLQEVYQIFVYINILYKAGISPDYVGIITPYQLQVLKIRQILEGLKIEPPKIGSVEEFQGQEKMIIILSVVRSKLDLDMNDTQMAPGFIRDPKRVNVALSRARSLLIIIGNPHVLWLDPLWKKVLRYCCENGYYTGCDLPYDIKQN